MRRDWHASPALLLFLKSLLHGYFAVAAPTPLPGMPLGSCFEIVGRPAGRLCAHAGVVISLKTDHARAGLAEFSELLHYVMPLVSLQMCGGGGGMQQRPGAPPQRSAGKGPSGSAGLPVRQHQHATD